MSTSTPSESPSNIPSSSPTDSPFQSKGVNEVEIDESEENNYAIVITITFSDNNQDTESIKLIVANITASLITDKLLLM